MAAAAATPAPPSTASEASPLRGDARRSRRAPIVHRRKTIITNLLQFSPLLAVVLMTRSSGMSVDGLSSPSPARFVGFDLGTSGARMSVIERSSSSSSGSGGSKYTEIHSDSILWSKEGDGREGGNDGGGGSYDDAEAWEDAVRTLLGRASSSSASASSSSSSSSDGSSAAPPHDDLLSSVRSICVSGTSASCLIVDAKDAGRIVRPARMYDYDVVARAQSSSSSSSDGGGGGGDPSHALKAMELLDRYAPPQHTARARTGALAKLLAWHCESPLRRGEVLCHQADYVAMRLASDPKKCGSGPDNVRAISSDWHNCLKLGYDVRELEWPEWMISCLEDGAGLDDALAVLPSRVVSPGEPVGTISASVASEYGLPSNCILVGGTTDSNAAFFAAAGADPKFGTAVTSLGSTLAIKQLSSNFVEDADRGVYSHRFPVFANGGGGGGKDGDDDDDAAEEEEGESEAWLIGGASNVGCAVLRQQGFSTDELLTLSERIDPSSDSPLSYYPLTKTGERFPDADPDRQPRLEPIPDDRSEYLHGLLQGIGDVEREGYRVLGDLGAMPSLPSRVLSCGGGARNAMWREMRRRRLGEIYRDGEGPDVELAENTEASYGAAVLAAATFD